MRYIKRVDYDTGLICTFRNTGVWGNGYLAYSKISDDGTISEYDDCAYYQVRMNGHLVMLHV